MPWSEIIELSSLARDGACSLGAPVLQRYEHANQGRKHADKRFPGIYKIEVLPGKFDPEIHGPTPILQIGWANNIFYRVGAFIGAARGFELWHSEGLRLWELGKRSVFHFEHLGFRWRRTKGPEDEVAELRDFCKNSPLETLRQLASHRTSLNDRWALGLKNARLPVPVLMSQVPGGAANLRAMLSQRGFFAQ